MNLRYLNDQGETEIVEDNPLRCRLINDELAEIDGLRQHFAVLPGQDEMQVWWQGRVYLVPLPSTSRRRKGSQDAGGGGLELISQMPGTILNVMSELGQSVEAGQPLVLMESMKMEMTLEAPSTGRVVEISCKIGARVDRGALLVKLEPLLDEEEL